MHPAESWLPGTQSVWLGDRWRFRRPTRRGESIHAAEELVEIREGSSERFGRTVTIVDRTSFSDAGGEVIATCDKTMLRRSPAAWTGQPETVGRRHRRLRRTARPTISPRSGSV